MPRFASFLFVAASAMTVLSGAACSGGEVGAPGGKACTDEAMQCPDGSYVGRSGPDCKFVCPAATCEALQSAAGAELDRVITSNASCTADEDCVTVARSADCVDQCHGVMNKSGESALTAAKAHVAGLQCKQFAAQGCKLIIPPCIPPGAPRCISGTCTER